MNGKLVIFIVVIVTLIGIGLAWFFLEALPTSTEEQSLTENMILYVNNWFTSYINPIR